ncbi:MAG: branched-chain amino acid ABC transporter permease [Pseudomonadota bacterium]
MNLQFLMDGLVVGATLALGATGVTLTYANLRFANFAHGEFLSWGAYLTMTLAGLVGGLSGAPLAAQAPFSIGMGLLACALLAAALTGVLALLIDVALFRRLRQRGTAVTAVMASFGVSMALRALLEALYSASPRYFSEELQIALPLGAGMRATPDQLAVCAVTVLLAAGVALLLARTAVGRQMRAVAENPSLAQVVGIDVAGVIRITWLLGGALAAVSGVALGLLVQVRPSMGAELLLPLFAAAIVGGIGSVPGAVVGGLIVGIAEAATVRFIGAEWRAAVSFALLIGVLLLWPTGLFGRRA